MSEHGDEPPAPAAEEVAVAVEEKQDAVAQDELVSTLRRQIDELNSQVTSLNQKLVQSYDRIGDLEDDLHEHRQTGTRLQSRVVELERDKERWDKEIQAGGWVEKNDVQVEMQRLMSQVMTETQNKDEAVKKHESLSAEIDNLTSSLFSEANRMVAVERIARAKAEDKMRTLEDSSSTMANLFEELQSSLRERVRDVEDKENEIAELRRKLAELSGNPVQDEREPTEDGAVVAAFSDGKAITPAQTPRISRPASPKPPTMNPPRLMKALPYQEFLAFIAYLRQLRVSVLSRPPESPHAAYTSAAAFAAARNFGNSTASATPPINATPAQLMAPHLPLSSHSGQPFIKRSIEEDSDPTVRLDIAPGLGMFSRRTVSSAIVDGNLMIEPVANGSTLPSSTCALCGTSLERWWSGPVADPATKQVNQTVRKVFGGSGWSFGSSSPTNKSSPSRTATPPVPSKDHEPDSVLPSASASAPASAPAPTIVEGDQHVQLHTFRSGDSASTRYPLCPNYCLPRLRSVCEFWTYVRVIERSLLLEDSFKIKDVDSDYDHRRNLSKSSLHSDRAMKSADSLALPAPSKIEPAPQTESVKEGSAKDDDDAEAVPEPEPRKSAEESRKSGEEPRKSTDEPRKSTDESEPMARSASGNAAKPPLPKRSAARTPALKSTEFSAPAAEPVEREQPQASYPLLPSPNLPATVPRPRISTATSATVESIVGSATGWEDRCWTEVVRLKEDLFWHRMPATETDGRPVAARGAKFE